MNNIKSDYKTRLMDKKDIESICNIDYEVFACPITKKDFLIYNNAIKTFPEGQKVITFNDEVIAFLTSEIWSREWEMEDGVMSHKRHNKKGSMLYISIMAVSKKHQGNYLGSILLDEVKENIKNNKNIEKVLLKTSRARAFYEKNGFIFKEFVKKGGGGYSVMEFYL